MIPGPWEIFATLGIRHPEIHGSVLVLGVTHIGGQHRKCIWGGSSPLFDAYQSVDRKRVSKAMGCRLGEVRISNNPSFLIEADLFESLMEDIFDLSDF